MTATAVDTLKIYERLRQAKLSNPAAKEVAEVFNDVLEANLATKADLEKVKIELNGDLEKTKAEINVSMEKAKASTIKWVVGILVAQTGILIALIRLLGPG